MCRAAHTSEWPVRHRTTVAPHRVLTLTAKVTLSVCETCLSLGKVRTLMDVRVCIRDGATVSTHVTYIRTYASARLTNVQSNMQPKVQQMTRDLRSADRVLRRLAFPPLPTSRQS